MLVVRSLGEGIDTAIIVDLINHIFNVTNENIIKPESTIEDKISPF